MKRSPLTDDRHGFSGIEASWGRWFLLGHLYLRPGEIALPSTRAGKGPVAAGDMVFDIESGDGWVYRYDEYVKKNTWSMVGGVSTYHLDLLEKFGNRRALRNIARRYGRKSPL